MKRPLDTPRDDKEEETPEINLDQEDDQADDVSDTESLSTGFAESNVREEVEEEEELPEIIPDYASDDSDEETINTIGNVPLEWYEDLDHIGYDINGKKIPKPKGLTKDALDEFLSTMDDPDSWRSVLNKLEGENVVLSDNDLDIIQRIQKKMIPDKEYDPYEPTTEWFTSKTEIHPLSSAPEPKGRFIPSKAENGRIMKIVRAIRKGWVKTKEQRELEKEQTLPKFYDIWGTSDPDAQDHPMHIPAPRMSLPEHRESYNPPIEYIPTEEEIAEWNALDPELRPHNYIPKKHPSLRSVGGYERFINERFERCLDLYLCPRMIKKRLNIDPESLIPQLPSRKELEPYPTTLSIVYEGHTKRIRCFSVDPTGKWLASGSDDCTVRCWEVLTGRLVKSWTFEEPIMDVRWNPNPAFSILALAIEHEVILVNPSIGTKDVVAATDEAFANIWGKESPTKMEWTKPGAIDYARGYRVVLHFPKNVTNVVWHRKGDYFSTVSPEGGGSAVSIHQISKKQTQHPFKKSYGLVQKVVFHPKKPWLFVATQRYIRVYNLIQQDLVHKLQPGVKWISSFDVHPQGDNVIMGSYDKRLCWFDLDLSAKPYKTLRYHKSAIRNAAYHKTLPLFASCSDDGTLNIFHGMVYDSLDQNPLIVPLKSFKAHEVVDSLGVLHCEFHPVQPWVFSCGASGEGRFTLKLFS
ncbi:UNVERIFIED_CONTAM: Ribosome biogenesis protein 1 [Siphonaria sp. JEL0065]|nr:Ribosome biogenesis protein 1 [Siphonaria sp. JEL0065]